MDDQSQKSYVTFFSTRFSLAWPKEDPDLAPPWGRDCAVFLAQSLREFEEVMKVDSEPYQVESGWIIDVALDDECYRVLVHWLPIGDPPRDYWAIQIEPLRGVAAWLFRRPLRQYKRLTDIIDSILRKTDGVDEVRWMSFDEFSKVY